jgi:hypothetical protein
MKNGNNGNHRKQWRMWRNGNGINGGMSANGVMWRLAKMAASWRIQS